MTTIDVVSDANVALKWFHHVGEEDVEASRALLDRHIKRHIVLHVLDLTFYEIGNALLRGRANTSAQQTATVLRSLREICPVVTPDDDDLALSADLAERHKLTLYDAAYAAVAQRGNATLVTFDARLLAADLGAHPSTLLTTLEEK